MKTAAKSGRRSDWGFRLLVAGLILLAAIVVTILYMRTAAWTHGTPVAYEDEVDHFKYGSIGSEGSSGLPYSAWQAMPRLFPEEFKGRNDYTAFGFIYEKDANGRQRDLPIGVSRRAFQGVDRVWLNCAVCHVGTWRANASDKPHIVPGMPSNGLDFGGFIRFMLGKAATDPRLTPETLTAAANQSGSGLGPAERLVWRRFVGPLIQKVLTERSGRMMPLMNYQPHWGPGRVDTFNPYKMLELKETLGSLDEAERVGTSDFPSIFEQRPREGMQLHWDGNNTSLMERNLSAAIGAGVTPQTADIPAVKRVAAWLMDLKPPPSPYRPDAAAAQRGSQIYRQGCAACHGYQDGGRYVFQGQYLGKVTPVAQVGTDPNRLNSYTVAFQKRQIGEIFKGTPYAFSHFKKTDGYANGPLDGLWLRAPYLHNGSVPTLADLLEPPERRPVAFLRGLDVIDPARGGFVAPACTPGGATPPGGGIAQLRFCFDTKVRGNANGGHLYGTDLPAAAKNDLLAYLLTF
jgi:mono/diheme cytochrome c family protein